MAHFKLTKTNDLARYISSHWRYFFKRDGIHITIGRKYITIDISKYYCVICNFLVWAIKSKCYDVTMDEKSLEWIKGYSGFNN